MSPRDEWDLLQHMLRDFRMGPETVEAGDGPASSRGAPMQARDYSHELAALEVVRVSEMQPRQLLNYLLRVASQLG